MTEAERRRESVRVAAARRLPVMSGRVGVININGRGGVISGRVGVISGRGGAHEHAISVRVAAARRLPMVRV